jgi:RNA polymerase sigma-70 factor (ECF subfamily)
MTHSEEFERLAGPLRAELVGYCYRMAGSADDAEDLAQETYLRAWRSYGTFEGRSSFRTWLYRIATNVCLDAIGGRAARPLPSGLEPPGIDPGAPVAAATHDVTWLQPLPGPGTGAGSGDPGAVVAARAGLRLALVAALQYLPARQRAVLILRDVFDWPAREAARILDMSPTAVNSSLLRARARLEQALPDADQVTEPADPRERDLASRYAVAFQEADLVTLVSLLRADVIAEMPPLPGWFAGAETVGRFLGMRVLAGPGRFTLLPLEANGQPAFATYLRTPDGSWKAHAIQVLEIAGGQVTRIVMFLDPGLFTTFGLPRTLAVHDAAATPALLAGGTR